MRRWKPQEIRRLRHLYHSSTTTYLRSRFPDRSPSSLTAKAFLMGLKRDLRQNDVSGLRQTIRIPTSPTIRAYAAGLFDGEGTIYFGCIPRRRGEKPYPRITLQIANTSMPVMLWLKTHFGGHIYKGSIRPRQRKQCYKWCSGGFADVSAFLKAIRPYLVIRTSDVDAAQRFAETHYPRLKEIPPSRKKSIGPPPSLDSGS